MTNLAQQKCNACGRGTPPIEGKALEKFLEELGGDWKVVNEHHLEKEFRFSNFKEALEFTNQIGTLAEQESHHPDLHLSWGKVRIVLWTHKINGLSENDFILAAKIDTINAPKT